MLKFWRKLFFFFLTSAGGVSNILISNEKNDIQEVAILERDFKKAIELQLKKIENSSNENKTFYTKELALLYLKDQDQELAFEAFLNSLKLIYPQGKTEIVSSFDEENYKKAFTIYLDANAPSPQTTAKNLLKALLPLEKEISHQPLLDYFVAIAYANLGKYEELFKHFYHAYQFYPEHYLAYKTKAVLHIKLLERKRSEDSRAVQRRHIVANLRLALDREPLDTTIYKLLISFSPAEDKKNQVLDCLNKIIMGNIKIPRNELMFYVIEAIDVNDPELAQRFIIKSKEWYQQSRMITAAQNYLDAHK